MVAVVLLKETHLKRRLSKSKVNGSRSAIKESCLKKSNKKAPTQQSVLSNWDFHARSGVRTLDTLIKSQVLCQLS